MQKLCRATLYNTRSPQIFSVLVKPKPEQLQKLVVFPTETVYGLGASAYDPDAILAVFEIKGRPSDNPLIVHVATQEMVANFAAEISEDAEKLMEVFWPGPLTLVLPKKPEVLDLITAGLNTVAIRMPNHPLALKVLLERGPMVAPSANKSGRPSPTSPEHIIADFGDSLNIIDGGKCTLGLESTVINMTELPYTILRPGHISASELASVLNKEVVHIKKTDSKEPVRSPGMKYSHYAPKAKVHWFTPGESLPDTNTLYLLFGEEIPHNQENIIYYAGDVQKMAAELYDRFRQADLIGYKRIAIEKPKIQEGLALALCNRIEKAASG